MFVKDFVWKLHRKRRTKLTHQIAGFENDVDIQ